MVTGLMSVTSLDGTDLALCEFEFYNNHWQYNIIQAHTIPYPSEWKTRLNSARYACGSDLIQLHYELGSYYGALLNDFHHRHGIKPDYIASHGHTILHRPEKGFCFQAGHGDVICQLTGIPVISDFRSRDIILGGQGAPLVPVGDELLFGEYDYCLNLGGIANISYRENNRRIAYDICPVNMALNHLSMQAGKAFDKDGELASFGSVNTDLLKALNALPYFSQSGPRSLGAEWFDTAYFPLLESFQIKTEDKLATVCEQIAEQIADQINPVQKGKMLLTGGGAKNMHLVKSLANKTPVTLVLPESKLIDFKEALIFAFLGLLRIRNEINSLAEVTGANFNSSTGIVYNPQND